MKHLAILNQPYLDLILQGKKRIESRFTKVRCAPYGKIGKGDTVLLKKSGGKVFGEFTVSRVMTFDLKEGEVMRIKEKYNRLICAEEDFWKMKEDSKYAVLIWISNLVVYDKPVDYKKKDRRTWIFV